MSVKQNTEGIVFGILCLPIIAFFWNMIINNDYHHRNGSSDGWDFLAHATMAFGPMAIYILFTSWLEHRDDKPALYVSIILTIVWLVLVSQYFG